MSTPAQYLGTGKRKTSVARVILRPGDGATWINGKSIQEYFPRQVHQMLATAPLEDGRARGSVRPPRSSARWRPVGPGRRDASRDRPCARRGQSRAARSAEARRLPDARRARRGAQEGRPAQGAQGAAVQQAVNPPLVARRYFGTDGVRGVVGEFLTPELVERLGRAAALWTGAAKVFVGRDTRASGVELEEAFARGVISAGGDCILGGVLPTPAVALLALDLGVVISASHNPPEYNGVKFFDSDGHKLSDASEEQIEAAARRGAGYRPGTHRARRRRHRLVHAAHRRAVRLRPQRSPHRRRLRQRRLLGARARTRSRVAAPRCTRSAMRPTARTSTWAAARPTSGCSSRPCATAATTSGSHSTATVTACSRWTSRAKPSTATRSSRSSRSTSRSTRLR